MTDRPKDLLTRTALDVRRDQMGGGVHSGSPLMSPVLSRTELSKYPSMTFTIAPVTTEGTLGPWNQIDRTLIMVSAVVMGTGSVSFNIEKRDAPSDAGVDLLNSDLTVSGNAEVQTIDFAVTTIEAGKRLFVDISGVSGIVTQLAITMIVTGGSSGGTTPPVIEGDMLKSVYDADNDGVVDEAEALAGISIVTVVGTPGSDDSLATEKAVRDAIGSGGGSSLPCVIPSPDTGAGTEASPYTDSVDDAAGIQTAIDGLAAIRGGKVLLKAARYDSSVSGGIIVATPGIKLSSVNPGFNIDPNGQSEGISGAKLRITGDGILIGQTSQKRGGIILEDLYLWGDISGTKGAIKVIYQVDQLKLNRIHIGGNFTFGFYCNTVLDASTIQALTVLGGIQGVYLDAAAVASYSRFIGCELDDNSGWGFACSVSATDANNIGLRLLQSTIIRNGFGTAAAGAPCNVHFGALCYSVIDSCVVRDAGHNLLGSSYVAHADGIIIPGDYNVISNNILADNSGWGLRIQGDHNVVVGNSFENNTDGNIIIETGAVGNIIIQPGLANITDNGTGTIILSGGISRSGSTVNGHLAVWDGNDVDSLGDGGAVPSGGGSGVGTPVYAFAPSSPLSTNSGSFVPLSSAMDLAITVGASGIVVITGGVHMKMTAIADCIIGVGVDSGGVTNIGGGSFDGTQRQDVPIGVVLTGLTPGAHTLKLYWVTTGGNTVTIDADSRYGARIGTWWMALPL